MIELMVAAAITALIAGSLVTIAANSAQVWKRGSSVLQMDNRANFIFSQLESDISSIVWYPGDRARAFFAEVRDFIPSSWSVNHEDRHWGGLTNQTNLRAGADSLDLTATNLRDLRFGRAGLHLGFLARTQDGNNPRVLSMFEHGPKNLPTFVSYQIVRQEEAWGGMLNSRYRLYRSVVRPGYSSDTSFSSFYETGTNLTDTSGNYRNVTSVSSDMDSDPFHPFSIEIPHPNMVLAEGVVDFGMVAYDADGQEINYVPDGSSMIIDSGDIGSIRSVVIFIRLLTDEGIQLLSQHEINGSNGDWWDDIVLPNSKVFVRRIPIRAMPY